VIKQHILPTRPMAKLILKIYSVRICCTNGRIVQAIVTEKYNVMRSLKYVIKEEKRKIESRALNIRWNETERLFTP
jgi:hypothetical protein